MNRDKNKISIKILFSAMFILLVNNAFADTTVNWSLSTTGTISYYHLNADSSYINREETLGDRGVCVQMVPALKSKWACLYKNNRLYTEINQLLLQGYLNKKKCTLTGATQKDKDNNMVIAIAECIN